MNNLHIKSNREKKWDRKIAAINLQETLIVLAIIGILLLLALPNLMPLISKAKSVEAQVQLKAIYNAQTTYRYMNSKYSNIMDELDFEAPKTVMENGTANYVYEIISADNSTFKARAEAITDFDGDGIMNVWEVDQTGNPKQVIKD
ncbi:general secretion pathway protein GspG [Flagellimonas nanhaiensis]|uniref:General secretion pathway protein GspG n=1 Tax=Flagellimonas nanhaiensis TaxID=2292706 RepID=A0A371JSI0_9FLAO|nr:general secretion pathway protein GspG [Allomuricauda nanhaiensis]RDY60770.1 general secretion pathway protein GspG [Allomuricauda nanhaiensis]